ncbi:hypothetical protein N7509_000897 [Penicillium cosmopolitanum]|uniref:Uncharacterized protein n=1 Tax=Penicillium cosmopolitanum TaxID=1131564 RepID=A0A9W9WBC6_9EURO|nr:uncharacterized protein N7509_000897 [Penicillium cosmopolitanum]KAJ5414270.1 hypothetical protein N7509_000897 [Penicillium cosmopolitanum]
MAPVLPIGDIPDIPVMSVETRDAPSDLLLDPTPSLNYNTLVARAKSTTTTAGDAPVRGAGTVSPSSIKMQGLMALFAIIGAAFVIAGIWFFFWAKNGGFVWRKGDWDDYKSTVLRRKGPDGKTLSNATKSTKLGGGSVVGKGYSDDGYSYADYDTYAETATNPETATVMTEDKPKKKRRNFRDKFRRRQKDEQYEGEGDDDVRAYREEKPARIGGMNRQAEGTYNGSDYDSSAVPTNYQQSEMSEVRDYAYEQPRRPHRGSRRAPRDFSFTAGSEEVLSQTTEESQLRDPSQRRQNRRRDRERERSAAPPPAPSSRTSSPRKKDRRSMPGHFTEPLDFSSAGSRSEYQYSNVDTEDSAGTKSYHHPIPGLTKGYRRDGREERSHRRRRDSLSDSD